MNLNFLKFPSNLISFDCTSLRLGLIRARLAGARLAKADSLIFLDAHCVS